MVGLVDAGGNLVSHYRYSPFGDTVQVLREDVPNRLRFMGREHDEETGLVFMRARYYDPELGRFISEDPIGLEGGINLYALATGCTAPTARWLPSTAPNRATLDSRAA